MVSRGVQNLNYSQCKCINIDLTNTQPQRVFSSVQTCGLLVDVNQPLPWFSRVVQEKNSSTRRNMSAFKLFLQYFATGSDIASCQDYEEYEFVECLSKETQIIALFTRCKLSQDTLATRLSL